MSVIDVGALPSYVDCTACGVPPSPSPTPTPSVPSPVPVIAYDYRIYTECSGSLTQVFRVVQGSSFPAVLSYNSICWENPQTTALTSTVDALGLNSYPDCATCITPAPSISYDYREYTECSGTATQIFRAPSGSSFAAVVKYLGTCYENPQTTASTSNVDITETYVDCTACLPTPSYEIFSTHSVGSGVGSSTLGCAGTTGFSMYTTRTNVASIQTQ